MFYEGYEFMLVTKFELRIVVDTIKNKFNG